MQESGAVGPVKTIEIEEGEGITTAKTEAVNWSRGQLRRPGDVLTVEIPELEYVAEITE